MHTVVHDVAGRTWTSDELTMEDLVKYFGSDKSEVKRNLVNLQRLTDDFPNMSYFSITVDGERLAFNPANIVFIKFVGFPTDDEIDAAWQN